MIQPQKIILNNGITLLLIETHQSPVVAFNACFRVGSVVETQAESGICHLIEHMIFKGTPSRPTGEIASAIESAGGDINAYTSFDETVYYCTVSSRYFDEGLNILSDAIINPLFDAKELEREKLVVIEEINRSHDTPGKVLSEALFKTAYTTHPYGRPIIGTKETVRSFTHENLLDFYHRWYVPKNLVFVVAGDFKSDHVVDKISKIFDTVQAALPPVPFIPAEPPQQSSRQVVVSKSFEGYYSQIAFPIPHLNHPDVPILDILSHLLGEGLSSRLEQRIKERKGLVDSIYSYAYTPRDPGLFVIGFTTSEKNLVRASEEILKEIFLLKKDKITHAELERAKVNIKSDAWYERESVEGLARKYGYFETILQDYNFDKKYYQRIDEVDPDAVHEMIHKYFRYEAFNLAFLLPEKSKLGGALKPEKIFKHTSETVTRRQKTDKQDVKVRRLPNGITLIFRENLHLPLVSIRLLNFGGLRFETPQTNGIHQLLARTLTKGTKSRSAEALAIAIEQIAGNVDAFSGRNVDGVQGDFLSEKLEAGLELFTDVLLNPSFEEGEIKKEKKNTLEAIRREHDQQASIAYKNFLAALYKNHPYGLPVLGTRESLASLTRKDLLQTHHQLLNPSQMTLSVVGDFDSLHVQDLFIQYLGHLKPRSPVKKHFEDLKPPSEIIKQVLKKSKMQSHIVLGFLGATLTSIDRYAMDVMNTILAGQGGRLFRELRDKLSLAYTVSSFSQEGIEPGFFAVYIATEPQKVNLAIEGILKELRNIKEKPVTSSELNRAKKYLIGSYEIEQQRNSHVATQLAFNEIYGLGIQEWKNFPEKISKITEKDLIQVAHKYINLTGYVLSIVGG